MLDVTAEMIADSLAGYREPAAAAWVLTCSDQDLALVSVTAAALLARSALLGSGTPMITARAVSLAAVFVHEGHPRALARQQRRRMPTHRLLTDSPWNPGRRPHQHVAGATTTPDSTNDGTHQERTDAPAHAQAHPSTDVSAEVWVPVLTAP